MPKKIPNKSYTSEFKQKAIETMRKEGLSYRETTLQLCSFCLIKEGARAKEYYLIRKDKSIAKLI